MARYYLTTAIFYPNAVPHLGTAYEAIGTDALARWRRLRGDDVFFLSGNDEHALKVAQVAQAAGITPLEHCDRMAAAYETAWKALGIGYDEYIRTTQPRHRETVRWFFERILERDREREAAGEPTVLYKGVYTGLYCVGCEAYLREKDLAEGRCPQHPDREIQHLEEENWFFRLSAFEERLADWFRDHPDWLRPEAKRNEMLGLLGEGLQDLSVSRPAKTIPWGIPFPGDEGHVVYVWFEALVNYVSGARLAEDGTPRPDEPGRGPGFWPADLHVIGKDIVRFHAVIWPAMLWAAGLELPRRVYSHGYVQTGGAKMSKSGGGVVSPVEVAEEFGADALRYFLLREIPWGGDGEFSLERLEERYASDLANTIGNLLHRTLTMIEKYADGEVPDAPDPDADGDAIAAHRARARALLVESLAAWDDLQVHRAVEAAVQVARDANGLVDTVEPWKRVKEDDGGPVVAALLGSLADSLKGIAALLSPVMPEKTLSMWLALGLAEDELDDLVLGHAAQGHKEFEHLEELHPDKVLEALDAVTVAGRAVRKGDPVFPRRDRPGKGAGG